MPTATPTPASQASAEPFVVPLSSEQRADIAAKLATLKSAMATARPAAQPLIETLLQDRQEAATAGQHAGFDNTQAFIAKRQMTLSTLAQHVHRFSEQRQTLERAMENLFGAVRTIMKAPVLEYISNWAETLLVPIFKDAQQRHTLACQSDLYVTILTAFQRDNMFYHCPADTLLEEAAACQTLAEGLLAGKSVAELFGLGGPS